MIVECGNCKHACVSGEAIEYRDTVIVENGDFSCSAKGKTFLYDYRLETMRCSKFEPIEVKQDDRL